MRSETRDKDILIAFGKHLKNIREAKKISQAKLGLEINSYQSTIIRIEKGKTNPSLCLLSAIAKSLDIDLKDLMDFKV